MSTDARPLIFTYYADKTAWTALDYLNLLRLFVGAMLAGLFFTPIMEATLPWESYVLARWLTIAYLIVSPTLLLLARSVKRGLLWQTMVGLIFDIAVVTALVNLTGGVSGGFAAILVVSTGAAGVIFGLRESLAYATFASAGLLWSTFASLAAGSSPTLIAPASLTAATYFATAVLGHYLSGRARESQALVRERSAELASMAELNEKIIERMRTGIMIVDSSDNAQLMNDAAWYLAGMPLKRYGKVTKLTPDVADHLVTWRETGEHANNSIRLAPGVPEIVPRFAPLKPGRESDVLVFLEDTSMVARRAQEITLASLGRLSASIAHEIRNPLSAISHSAQLLVESDEICEPDRRLCDIVVRHCNRMNEIIENVLQLARQEPSRPEIVRLGEWISVFADDFRRGQDESRYTLTVIDADSDATALMDPVQMQQIVWNLCQNAMKYGRSEDGKAHIALQVGYSHDQSGPFLAVRDRGPGILEKDQERIFQPFFTTSIDGTGLGLYLCQQICAANHARLEYQSDDYEGGSEFIIHFQSARE